MSSGTEVKSVVAPPPVGQSFVDREGVYWTVKNIIEGANLEGFFLVCLEHGKSPQSLDGTLVLAPSEYEALIRSRGLKVLAPDLAHPVPLVSVNERRLGASTMPSEGSPFSDSGPVIVITAPAPSSGDDHLSPLKGRH